MPRLIAIRLIQNHTAANYSVSIGVAYKLTYLKWMRCNDC